VAWQPKRNGEAAAAVEARRKFRRSIA
jgi:hypothetical protein